MLKDVEFKGEMIEFLRINYECTCSVVLNKNNR